LASTVRSLLSSGVAPPPLFHSTRGPSWTGAGQACYISERVTVSARYYSSDYCAASFTVITDSESVQPARESMTQGVERKEYETWSATRSGHRRLWSTSRTGTPRPGWFRHSTAHAPSALHFQCSRSEELMLGRTRRPSRRSWPRRDSFTL
jgi:hypothetical protein